MIASILDQGEASVSALRDAIRVGRPEDIAIAAMACEAWCDATLLALRASPGELPGPDGAGRDARLSRARALAAGAEGARRMASRGRRFMRGLLSGSRVAHGAAYGSDARSTGDTVASLLISRNA